MRVTAAVSTLLAALLVTAALAAPAPALADQPTAITHEPVPVPTVTGPIAGTPFTASPIPLGPAGYTQQEYFLTGMATGYQEVGAWGADGHWSVAPAEQADYATRILVRRPANPARFNGTVVVEWLNVSAGVDLDFDYLYDSAELLSQGYAWVGVSAQATGVNALRALDPSRYGALHHPGDTFSYSIFSQAARALTERGAGGVDPLAGLKPKALIADGQSQSALRLSTYVNAIQPIDGLFSGFLLHSRSAGSAALSQSPQAGQATPALSYVRTDIGVPVLILQTETDLFAPLLEYYPATQTDSRDIRLWEIAGASHLDATTLNLAVAEVTPFLPTPPSFSCDRPANDGAESAVVDDAVAQLNRWVRGGPPAQHAPRVDVSTASGSPAIVRDQFGNALGGIRTPDLQAPTSTLSGYGNTGSSQFCFLFGTTTPFTSAQLSALYPTHGGYVAAVSRAAFGDVLSGFLLPMDAQRIVAAAVASPVPSAAASSPGGA